MISLAIEVDVVLTIVPRFGAYPHALRMVPGMARPVFVGILCHIDYLAVDKMVRVSDLSVVGETPALGR